MSEWFAVFSRTNIRIFKRGSLRDPIQLIHQIENPLARERNKVLQRDRVGRERQRVSYAFIPGSMSGGKDPHKEAAEQFIRKTANYLNTERAKNSFDSLHIVSDSFVAGVLRNTLDEPTLGIIEGWNLKNLNKKTDEEVAKFLGTKLKSNSAKGTIETDNEVSPDDIPQNITFRDIAPSNSVILAVQRQIEKLKRFQKRLHHCEVILSAPHRKHHKGVVYHVEIRLGIPGEDIFISRAREKNKSHTNIYIAIRDEFEALKNALISKFDIKRGYVKNHSVPQPKPLPVETPQP